MNKITIFVERLKKIGIEVKLAGNYPWIYLDEINGQRVKERYLANHGFTAFWYPDKITDIGEIFKILRKYGK